MDSSQYYTPKYSPNTPNYSPQLAKKEFLTHRTNRKHFHHSSGNKCNSLRHLLKQRLEAKISTSTNEADSQHKPSLLKLGDWVKFTARSLYVQKNVYNRAVLLLNMLASKHEPTYFHAGAALSLLVKFECNGVITKHYSFPASWEFNTSILEFQGKPSIVVRARHLLEFEAHLLKITGFRVPSKDTVIDLIMSLSSKWTRYVRVNASAIKYPLKCLEFGLTSFWERRNIFSAAYLVDVIHLEPQITQCCIDPGTLRRHEREESLIVMLAIYLVCAANTSEGIHKINYGSKLQAIVCRQMIRCLGFKGQDIQDWRTMLRKALRTKLPMKLIRIPLQREFYEAKESPEGFLECIHFVPMADYDSIE